MTKNLMSGDVELSGFENAMVRTPDVTSTSQNQVFLKVAVRAAAANVKVCFDPVSVESTRQTKELNRSVRLGFLPPAASTRS